VFILHQILTLRDLVLSDVYWENGAYLRVADYTNRMINVGNRPDEVLVEGVAIPMRSLFWNVKASINEIGISFHCRRGSSRHILG
jgi:hypothetical protein